jgi:uncharacterized OB-fold protein
MIDAIRGYDEWKTASPPEEDGAECATCPNMHAGPTELCPRCIEAEAEEEAIAIADAFLAGHPMEGEE